MRGLGNVFGSNTNQNVVSSNPILHKMTQLVIEQSP